VALRHPVDCREIFCFRETLPNLDDAKVAFCARNECLKRLLICLAFMGGEGDLIAVELDQNRPQLQSGFVCRYRRCVSKTFTVD
jgi:hypothetical protein